MFNFIMWEMTIPPGHYDDNDNEFIFQFAQVAYEHNLQIYIMNNIDNGIIQIGGRRISMYSCGLTCPRGNFKYINYICCELKIVTKNIKFCIFGLDTVWCHNECCVPVNYLNNIWLGCHGNHYTPRCYTISHIWISHSTIDNISFHMVWYGAAPSRVPRNLQFGRLDPGLSVHASFE